jgi:hypothetical protein
MEYLPMIWSDRRMLPELEATTALFVIEINAPSLREITEQFVHGFGE